MAKSKKKHPIRLVRDLLKGTPVQLRLRRYATAAGFASLIGRSPSHLRNVECGSIENWENLAQQIEKRTKVSSKWLLSNPDQDDPVLDVDGEQWRPELYLDRLAPREGMPDWRYLIEHDPGVIPKLMSHLVESQIILEMSLGHQNFIANLIEVLARSGTFQNPALRRMLSQFDVGRSMGVIGRAMISAKVPPNRNMKDIEGICGTSLELARIDDLVKVIDLQGYGWASKLENPPKNGLLAEAGIYFEKKYREPITNLFDADE